MITDWDYYINFVILVVTGRIGEADTIMVSFGDAIHRCSQELAHHFEPTPPAYRGLLIEPDILVDGCLPHETHREFLSWSEDLDVALWFANRDSVMNGLLAQLRPKASGYVAVLMPPDPELVLWRSCWAVMLTALTSIPLQVAAAMHPQVDALQFRWNLSTQNEIITLPLGSLRVTPASDLDSPPIEELDGRLCFPGAR